MKAGAVSNIEMLIYFLGLGYTRTSYCTMCKLRLGISKLLPHWNYASCKSIHPGELVHC